MELSNVYTWLYESKVILKEENIVFPTFPWVTMKKCVTLMVSIDLLHNFFRYPGISIFSVKDIYNYLGSKFR